MFDIGNTHPETLYDFAVALNLIPYSCLDPNSELYNAFKQILDSAWGQIPELLVLDFRPDLPTPKPPLSLIWDETTERYI